MERLLDQYFTTKKRHVTMGVEVEMYLYDRENESLLGNNDEDTILLNECFKELPNTVTKDHYNYQLEIRTNPHIDPEELIKEFQATMLLCREVFAKRNIEIKPLSWLGGNENMNGMHVHFRNGNRTLYQTSMFNMYPFVLSLTDCFKNSVYSKNNLSRRLSNSSHIGFPDIKNLSRKLIGDARFKDIIVNGYTENTRHRLKSVPTIEIRTFDVPYNFDYFKNLIRLLFNLYQHINTEVGILEHPITHIEKLLKDTREDIYTNRDGLNFLFDQSNRSVYEYLCEKFNIEKLITPVTLIKNNIVFDQSTLKNTWKKLGTKVWLGEDILKTEQIIKPIVESIAPWETDNQLPEDEDEDLDETD